MKLTKSKLRQLIKEEITNVLKEREVAAAGDIPQREGPRWHHAVKRAEKLWANGVGRGKWRFVATYIDDLVAVMGGSDESGRAVDLDGTDCVQREIALQTFKLFKERVYDEYKKAKVEGGDKAYYEKWVAAFREAAAGMHDTQGDWDNKVRKVLQTGEVMCPAYTQSKQWAAGGKPETGVDLEEAGAVPAHSLYERFELQWQLQESQLEQAIKEGLEVVIKNKKIK